MGLAGRLLPWKDLKVNTPENKRMGFLFSRNRPGRENICQLPVIGGNNHSPENFGTLRLKSAAESVPGK
jgi:hypothetical protein